MAIGKAADNLKTTFVMGVNGFVGHHLAHELATHGHRVIGVGNAPELAADLTDTVHAYISCDLTNPNQVNALPLREAAAIINLAGLASIGASFGDPDTYLHTNVAVHTNVCDALQKLDHQSPRIIAVSTGAVYDSSAAMPLDESSPVSSTSPYAASKLRMEAALEPYRQDGFDIITVRPFNHTGPGQGGGFLVPDLLKQLREAAAHDFVIKVGNLKTKRDYTDVRDIARAYRLLAEAPKTNLTGSLYNICSGTSHPGTEILEALTHLLHLDDKLKVETDASLIRPNDPLDIYGSHHLLTHDTGWAPEIPFEQTLRDFVATS